MPQSSNVVDDVVVNVDDVDDVVDVVNVVDVVVNDVDDVVDVVYRKSRSGGMRVFMTGRLPTRLTTRDRSSDQRTSLSLWGR